MTEKTYTDAQIEDMEKTVMEFRAKKAQEAHLAREAHLANIRAIVSSDSYRTTLDGLRDVQAQYATDDTLAPHLHAITGILEYVAGLLGVSVAPESTIEDVQPLPVDFPESDTQA